MGPPSRWTMEIRNTHLEHKIFRPRDREHFGEHIGKFGMGIEQVK